MGNISALSEMCEHLDEAGIHTYIQGTEIHAGNFEIHTIDEVDKYGQYKYDVVFNHTWYKSLDFFDALWLIRSLTSETDSEGE